MTPRVARGVACVAALAVGLLVGTVGAFLQAARSLVLGSSVPWGALLVLVCLAVLVRGAVEMTATRWAGWALLAGWLGATVVFASPMPWGAMIITSGHRQVAYLVSGVMLGAVAAAIPPLAGRRSPRSAGHASRPDR